MKNLIFCCLMIVVISCNNSNNSTKLKMEGAYLMEYQTVSDGAKDTKYTDLAQLKIYTDSFMMYTQVDPIDSISAFGVGSYTVSDSGLIKEHDFYSSRDTAFSTNPSDFNLYITMTPESYKQVIPKIMINSQNFKLTEEYHKVGTDQKSSLDGLWKETKSVTVKGNDTTKNDRTQYKAFGAGYFMYGQTVKDPSGQISTGVGFGTFTPQGQDQIKELDLNSTYPIVVGQTFMVDIKMDGTDRYSQIVHNADSSTTLEYYERVKKTP